MNLAAEFLNYWSNIINFLQRYFGQKLSNLLQFFVVHVIEPRFNLNAIIRGRRFKIEANIVYNNCFCEVSTKVIEIFDCVGFLMITVLTV